MEHSSVPEYKMNRVQWEADWKEEDRSQTAQEFMGQLK